MVPTRRNTASPPPTTPPGFITQEAHNAALARLDTLAAVVWQLRRDHNRKPQQDTEEYVPLEANDGVYIAFRKEHSLPQNHSGLIDRESQRAQAKSRKVESPSERGQRSIQYEPPPRSPLGSDMHHGGKSPQERPLRFRPSQGSRCAHSEEGPNQSPFSRTVRKEPLPQGFNLPRLPDYDGRGDPTKHVQRYRDTMQLYGYSDAIQCRVFPCTLSGNSRDWFETIAPDTIHNFADITALLTQQFSDISQRNEQRGNQSIGKRKLEKKASQRATYTSRQKRSLPLNAPIEVVLKAARVQGLLPAQPTIISRDGIIRKNPTQFCAYHGKCAHSSGECSMVKSDIETLVRQGHLLEYTDIAKLMNWANVGEQHAMERRG